MTAFVLLVVGYLVALAVLARLRPVLTERRAWRFAALESAMTSIVVGWLLHERPLAALFNGAAVVALAAAWLIVGRRGPDVARSEP